MPKETRRKKVKKSDPSAKRQRVLIIGEVITLAHMARPMCLAGMLNPRKYDVHLAFDPRFAHLLPPEERTRVIPLVSQVAAKEPEDVLQGKQTQFDLGTLDAYVREDLELIERIRPDVIIGDMRLSLAISAPAARVPLVTVMNAHMSPNAGLNFQLPRYPIKGLGNHLAELLWTLGESLTRSVWTAPFNWMRVRYGLSPLGDDIRTILCYGDYVLYPDIPELSPLPDLGRGRYIGPLLWSPDTPFPEWWDRVPDGRRIVYVNLGSSGNPALLDMIVSALGRMPVSALVATGGRILTELPPNVYCAPFLPGSATAARASLTICNGGSMPVQQSFAEGVPVLGITSNLDQAVFMQNVCRSGAGSTIPEGEMEPFRLHSEITRLICHPAYREAAQRLQSTLPKLHGAKVLREVLAQAGFNERESA